MNDLFKYRAFDSFAQDIFLNNRLWMSLAKHLDDPEELAVANTGFPEVQNHVDDFRSRVTLLSLSKESCIKRLWQEYADNTKGFVLRINFEEFKKRDFDNEYHFTEVEYVSSSAVQIFSIQTIFQYKTNPEKLINEVWEKIFFTKNSSWGYQKELRVMFINQQPVPQGNYLCLLNNSIKEVFIDQKYVGKQDFKNLKEWVDTHNKKFNSNIKITTVDTDSFKS